MEHASHLVDVLDTSGHIVGQKKRQEINKQTDTYHSVFVLLITPQGEIVLGVIPPREDLPNLYARLFGTPVATIRRHNESAQQAAKRALSRELFIDEGDVQLLGETMLQLPEERHTYASAYYIVGDPPAAFSVIDVETLAVVMPSKLDDLIDNKPHEVAPTLTQLWNLYRNKLPI